VEKGRKFVNLGLCKSMITSVITEPERAIIHFKTTRKSGFACITLLCVELSAGVNLFFVSHTQLDDW
jgi:hypothetical protein